MSKGETLTFASLLQQSNVIEIPIIQRDYVQGRESAQEVRIQFIQAIYQKLSTEPNELYEPLDLDFIYGSLQGEDAKNFWPLDGQQRLTTLFLLHWYLANRDDELAAFKDMMLENGHSRFTYQTRKSSRMFFNALTLAEVNLDNLPESSRALSQSVRRSKWFFVSFDYDPTVKSALNMLDTIHDNFKESKGHYQRLLGIPKAYVTFQFLNLHEFGLSDDLYIKMNARGKPLTPFENFKAKFEQTVGMLCSEETKTLHGKTFSVKEYLSRKIDTDWADLFWEFCEADTQKIDESQMEFFRSLVGVLYPISCAGNTKEAVSNVLRQLRDDKFEPSHFRYKEMDCFSKEFVLNLLSLMDKICSEQGVFCEYLNDSPYYSEKKIFRLSTERLLTRGRNTSGLTYQSAIQFFAWCVFLIEHDEIKEKALFDWTRIVHNLSENSRYDDVKTYTDSLYSLYELLVHSDDIIGYLVNVASDQRLQGFYRPQLREERIKAQLIRRSDNWRKLVLRAEQHPYFKGQIEFLLDFSGILEYFLKHDSCDWNNQDNESFQCEFEQYLRKAEKIFGPDDVIDVENHLFKRALLVKGDYLLRKGSNYSFLTKGFDRDISWKRLLRGSESANDESQVAQKRRLLKALMDDIDATDRQSIQASLEHIIATASGLEDWRQCLVDLPQAFEYCESSFIRREAYYKHILLLKRSQTNGSHHELRAYHLYETEFKNRDKQNLHPFSVCRIVETYSVDDIPEIRFSGMRINNSKVILAIRYSLEKFKAIIRWDSDEEPQNVRFLLDYYKGADLTARRIKIDLGDVNIIEQIDNLLSKLESISTNKNVRSNNNN